ncbi:MAG: hypothetical protein HY248_06975, partial [Fimbriimonas ginsengisoli]|nr:hypothetical protein [Fimbriimonas ginsengisoli]
MKIVMSLFLTGLLTGAPSPASTGDPEEDPIAAGFREAPTAARLRLFWRIFGPAWTPVEIDRQLEELRRVGVGGVMTCFTYPLSLDDPGRGIRNQHYLSPEFLDTLAHAARKARQLGLEFGVCGGTGWPFGGPSVTLADAAQRVRLEATTPLPDGAGYQLPALREGERYLAAFRNGRNVTEQIQGDRLVIPATDSRTVVFITGPTFMAVKRAALGGEGYVVDHFSHDAILRYLEAAVAPMLRAAPNGLIRALF